MKNIIRILNIQTRSERDFSDITSKVKEEVSKSGVKDGIVLVRSMHTTAAVTINENVHESVPKDLLESLEKISPTQSNYRHNTYVRFCGGVGSDTGAAHVHASLIGSDILLPLEKGEIKLGTLEGIFFLDFSGPRERKVLLQIFGE